MAATGRKGNRLLGEPSAYLRSAAHQPVDWYPWGEEAFARAKAEDKPILLDIGAVWCHWCHVIDQESYEDPEIAKLINERFVPVKVDRDERPDVDSRYQSAVNAISGQGGWPLTAFLTPDGKVFYGGTYFPPKDLYGRPSFRRILISVSDHYKKERADAINTAESLHQALAERRRSHVHEVEVDEPLLKGAVDGLKGEFDPVNGGFGNSPKFPHPGTIEFLLARYHRTKEDGLRNVITRTLTGMARGGVYDHVGGGFHRYSTDAMWIVPHFEKMAYDNAALLSNYAKAWAVFKDPLFRVAAEGIIRWTDEVLSDRVHGGFYASQDADVGPGDDGDFFTWTLKEVRAICTEEETTALAWRYDIGERGEMHHNPAKNVLYADKTPAEIAKETGWPIERVDALLKSGLEKLRAARARRPTPFVDRTVYANWNAMYAVAYLEAWRYLGREDCRDFALKTLRLAWDKLWDTETGMHHQWANGVRRITGFLEDHVWFAAALLDAYEATQDPEWLGQAETVTRFAIDHFWDAKGGGFFDLTHDAGGSAASVLALKRKPVEDSPSPSSNGIAGVVLQRLHHFTGKEDYRARHDDLVRAFAGEGSRMGGIFGGAYFLAAELWLHPPAQVVIVGPRNDVRTKALLDSATTTFGGGKTVLVVERNDAYVPAPVAPMLSSKVASGGPVAFVCQGTTCSMPTSDPEKLRTLV
ncbi:MAG: thioredoxin domain-containing protein [Methanobacteriota archaeon]|nr:MAG: thioredoxin domain-containing protein [Euryarchaeota archaeon]